MNRHLYPVIGCFLCVMVIVFAKPVLADELSIDSDADLLASRFLFEVEGGAAWQTRNDVQIPNNDLGTRFSLTDLVGTGPLPAFRTYFTWNINQRHSLRVLFAPLSYIQSGIFDQTVHFNGETYDPGVPVEATYKFNYLVASVLVGF